LFTLQRFVIIYYIALHQISELLQISSGLPVGVVVKNYDSESVSHIAATIGGGFFAGIVMGYALEKVVRLAPVVVGLFFAGILPTNT